MASNLTNLLLNALQLAQGAGTQAEVGELLRERPARGGGGVPELSEAQQEAADLRADLFLLGGKEPARDCACPEELCVHVVGLDDCD